jgi:drug/metabolite transporter (DMT)-like permease
MLSAARTLLLSGSAGRTGPAAGIAFILLAVVMFVGQDALGKYLSSRYPVWQVVWARYAFHMVLMAPFLLSGRVVVRTFRPVLQLFRSFMLVGVTFLFFTSVQFMPIATANAIGFLAPLLVTALSVPLLGERVGPRRWAAVLVGFAGVMVVIRPNAGMEPIMLLPVGMAFCFALYQISTRLLSRTDSALTTLFWTAVGGLAASSVVLPFNWRTPDIEGWLLLAGIGAAGCVSHLMMIKAYALAPAAVLAPFTYVQLVLAIPVGLLLFGDMPDIWMMIGSTLIVGSGLYIWHRERTLARSGARR